MKKSKRNLIFGALLLLMTIAAVGCSGPNVSSEKNINYGPMAVINYSGDFARMARGGKGVMMITDKCIYLNVQPDVDFTTKKASLRKLLLVWPSGRSKWDVTEKAVIYKDISGETLTIRNGDVITVGGAAIVNDRNIEWLSPPDKSCKGRRWSTESIEVSKKKKPGN